MCFSFLFHSSCRFSFLLFYFCFFLFCAFGITQHFQLSQSSMMKVFFYCFPLPMLLLLSLPWHYYGEGFTPSVNAQRSKTSHEVCKVTPCA